MNREYHKGYSQELHREMETLVFGHAGTPLLVFPTSMGKFFEYEDRGMIGVLAQKIERGELQVFCTGRGGYGELVQQERASEGARAAAFAVRALYSARICAVHPLEKSNAAAGHDWMQFWRVPCGEFCPEAS